MKLSFDLSGMDDLRSKLQKVSAAVRDEVVNKAAAKGMDPVKQKAKAIAPVDKGHLREAIITAGETSKFESKAVYRIVFDRAKNDIFQKVGKTYKKRGRAYRRDLNGNIIKNANGRKQKYKTGYKKTVKNKKNRVTAYYPISQEYGYFSKGGKLIPGKRFISGTFEQDIGKFEDTVLKVMKTEIDREIRKAGLN
ncbi:MAG: hypothetical protein FWE82_08925 [Defluviitaleaceae bacterium]|nr:hypothetical protein [Defluviitaleaceae bacterium]